MHALNYLFSNLLACSQVSPNGVAGATLASADPSLGSMPT